MNKFREALRLILTTTMSSRAIGRYIGLSHNTVHRYRVLAFVAGVDWVQVQQMDDTEVEALLSSKRERVQYKQMPDWAEIHREMQLPDVTLQLLWEDYRLANPGQAYSYSQFTYYYRDYEKKLDLVMRQTHRAGECAYVDFAGRTVPYTELSTGMERQAQVFVGVLGCSSNTFAYAVQSQSVSNWILAHNQMFLYYGGAPQIVVPDNLKAAVICSGAAPKLNRTYLELARHYGVVIVPARVRHPRDKAKAEVGVLLVSRWILAKLRKRKFFSLEEINAAITELLKELNERPFKKLPGCRRSRFEELDKPLLKPLPEKVFEYAEWVAPRKVGPDYHVPVFDHYYSVPCSLVGNKVEARVTATVVELFCRSRRVASHPKSLEVGGHTTSPSHQPKSHRHYANQTPEKLIEWAHSIGEAAVSAFEFQFEVGPHAQVGIRACATLKRLAKDYGHERFEAACERGLQIGSLTTKSIRSILQRGLDSPSSERAPVQVNLPLHDNVRGPGYYSTGGFHHVD